MKKTNRLFGLLILLLIFTLVGCKSDDEQVSSTNDENSNVTFTYFSALPGKDGFTNETTIGKILEEQTGVNWKMEHIVGDVNTKLGTMIASNEYPDIIAPDVAIDKMLDAGAFIPLNDLIEEHGPNIKRVYGSYFNLMKSDDGNIYTLPFSPLVGEYTPDPNIDQGAFWVQRRVLKEFDYPEINTLDEYFDMIKEYMDKHPEEDLIGFNSLTYDWRIFATTSAPMFLSGYPNDGWVTVNPETQKAEVYADKEMTKQWLKKLNEVNSSGIYDKSSFVDNYDQYLAKLTSGKVLGTFNFGWQIDPAYSNLQQAGNDDLSYFPLPVTFDEGTREQYQDAPSFVTGRGVGITVSAESPERIIKFYDNLLSDENQILTRWGIEGETYEKDETGRFYRTEQQIAETSEQKFRETYGFEYFDNLWPRYGEGSTLSDGNALDPLRQPEVAELFYTDGDKEILEKYGSKTFSGLLEPPIPVEERPWFPGWSLPVKQGSPAEIYSTKAQDLQEKYFAKLVMADPDDFEKIWDEYDQEHDKLDYKAYEETMNEEIQKRIDIANGN